MGFESSSASKTHFFKTTNQYNLSLKSEPDNILPSVSCICYNLQTPGRQGKLGHTHQFPYSQNQERKQVHNPFFTQFQRSCHCLKTCSNYIPFLASSFSICKMGAAIYIHIATFPPRKLESSLLSLSSTCRLTAQAFPDTHSPRTWRGGP